MVGKVVGLGFEIISKLDSYILMTVEVNSGTVSGVENQMNMVTDGVSSIGPNCAKPSSKARCLSLTPG